MKNIFIYEKYMKIVTNVKEMIDISAKLKYENKTIGFVPTMGALHSGHLHLCDKSNEITDKTIMSIFVNPTQFAPNEDYEKYPRNLENDANLANLHNVDYIFAPNAKEIYPENFSTNILIVGITDVFEGKKRPGHFNGVALVVAKLFNIIEPNYSFFGQKDYQQTLVIKKMTDELNFKTEIVIVPTIRLENGLAMSSRNSYLSELEIQDASIIYKTMLDAKCLIEKKIRDRIKINEFLINKLSEVKNLQIDYACAAIAEDLSEPDVFQENDKIVILIAVYIGKSKTRLIDNMLV